MYSVKNTLIEIFSFAILILIVDFSLRLFGIREEWYKYVYFFLGLAAKPFWMKIASYLYKPQIKKSKKKK